MALTQKHRSTIYQRLQPILGEEEAEALLSQFPSRELDEPVTKEFVRAEIAQVRAEITQVRAEITQVRAELVGGDASIRAELHDRLRAQTAWFTGAIFGGISLAVAIGTFLG